MGNRDLELLLATKSGDTVKYQQFWDRLARYANSIATELFSSPMLRENAIEKALDKASDWLVTDGVLYIDHPWAYIKKIVSNSLIDSARTRNLEEVSPDTLVRQGRVGKTIGDELALIDETFVKFQGGDEENDNLGVQVFQTIDKEMPRNKDDTQHPSLSQIDRLNQLFKFKWWWDIDTWRGQIRQHPRRTKGMRDADINNERAKYQKRLWSKYNLLTAEINSIRGASEKRIVQHRLWGFTPVNIERELMVSKQYVSRILIKWLGKWEDSDLYQAQLISLTNYLAYKFKTLSIIPVWGECLEIYGEIHSILSQQDTFLESTNFTDEDFEFLYSEGRESIENLLVGRQRPDLLQQWKGFEATRKQLRQSLGKKLAQVDVTKQQAIRNCYLGIIKSPQARIYLGDVPESEKQAFILLCQRFHERWFEDYMLPEEWYQRPLSHRDLI